MSNLGLGVMLHLLSGGSEHNSDEFYGRLIVSAKIDDNRVVLDFDDGVKIAIFDDGQSCCEHRYLNTDDDITSLVGNTLARIEAKHGPTEEDEEHRGVHETMFVEIGTNKGFVTLANHNEHNGYYGGFGLTIKELDPNGRPKDEESDEESDEEWGDE